MVAADRLPEFLLAVFVLIVVPGPSVLFVVSRGVALGRRAALATVLGNATGLAVQVVLVAAGIGAIVQRSLAVFTAIKLVGAAYLLYLGARTIRSRRALAEALDATVAPRGARRIVREGFVVGATNPKGLLILTAVLPQFVERGDGHVPLQMLVLGSICVAIALVSDSAWGLVAGTARLWLARSPRALEAVGGASGLVMIGLGIRLATTGRRD